MSDEDRVDDRRARLERRLARFAPAAGLPTYGARAAVLVAFRGGAILTDGELVEACLGRRPDLDAESIVEARRQLVEEGAVEEIMAEGDVRWWLLILEVHELLESGARAAGT